MIKQLILAGAVVGAAYLLRDKTSRDRLVSQARKMFEQGRERIGEARSAASSAADAVKREMPRNFASANTTHRATPSRGGSF